MKKIVFLILYSLFYILYSNLVFAKEPTLPTVDEGETTSLAVTPSIDEAVLSPGNTTSQIFELNNGSNIPLPIKSYIRTFDASDEVGGVSIPDQIDTQRLSPESWISVLNPDFIIQPQTIRQVQVDFSPPADLPPGGYYAIIFFEPLLPESFLSESSLSIGGRIGALLFMIGPGDISEKAEIVSFSTNKFHINTEPIKFNLRIKDNGNVHIKPSGTIEIKNLLAKSSRKSEVAEFTILPGKIRQKEIESKISWPGVYQAHLHLVYGRDKIKLDKELTFVYFPYLWIIGIFVFVLVLFFTLKKRYRQNLVRAVKMVLRGK